MLTEKEAFRVAFLQSCAQQGLGLDEAHALVKQALAGPVEKAAAGNPLSWVAGLGGDVLKKLVGGVTDTATGLGGDLLRGTGKVLGTSLVLAPLGMGAASGYALGRGAGLQDEDIEEEKQRELTEAYRAATERLQMQRRLAERRQQAKPRAGRQLML